MSRIWKNYNLSIVLFFLFIVSWFAQGFFQWQEFVETQQTHRQPVEVMSFVPEFLAATFENWQSEFLQLFTMVVLTSFLIHKGSPESRDSTDQMQMSLKRIEKMLANKK